MKRLRVVLVAFVGCTAPLTIAEPRGGAGDAAVEASGDDGAPPFGDRPDVDMEDQFASIQSEGGLAD